MKEWIAMLAAIFILSINIGYSQQLFPNTNIQNAYKNHTRTDFGKPGKNYWQSFANYQIKVNFDPSTQLLQG